MDSTTMENDGKSTAIERVIIPFLEPKYLHLRVCAAELHNSSDHSKLEARGPFVVDMPPEAGMRSLVLSKEVDILAASEVCRCKAELLQHLPKDAR